VRAGFDLDRRPGRCEFRPARVVGLDGTGAPVVEVLSPSFSARIAMLAAADGLAVLPAEADRVRHGDMLEWVPL
jgi:molybdopterin molybdotransferase